MASLPDVATPRRGLARSGLPSNPQGGTEEARKPNSGRTSPGLTGYATETRRRQYGPPGQTMPRTNSHPLGAPGQADGTTLDARADRQGRREPCPLEASPRLTGRHNLSNIFLVGTRWVPKATRAYGHFRKPLINLAPQDGLEPPTQWLTATCSTD